ncbi:hypothetical protein E3N88_37599 [Mikania micrantha]|uniref:Uncharacterized protein n=1 Tax=Mikania micrantha TaxID=192012 RepID=A0A5N6LTW1_9ASTR|nr:hypothetical protein E3N88_37599 [Mikania micrantha]
MILTAASIITILHRTTAIPSETLTNSQSRFKIKITRSGGMFKVNDDPITFPDMYHSDSVVILGIRCILSLPKPVDEVSDGDGNPFDETPTKTSGSELIAFAPDRSEY